MSSGQATNELYQLESRYLEVARLLETEMSAAEREQFRSLAGLVVLTPATLMTGRVQDAFRFLEEHGLTITFQKALTFDAASVQEIWKYQLTTFTSDRWSQIIAVLTIGPSLLCVVRASNLDGRSASAPAFIKSLKGPSDPEDCEPYTIRRRLGAINKVVNMLHSSETPDDVWREAGILLLDADLLGMVEGFRLNALCNRDVHRDAIAQSFTARDCSTPVQVANRIRWRLLAATRYLCGESLTHGFHEWEQRVRAEFDWASGRSDVRDHRQFTSAYRSRFGSKSLLPSTASAIASLDGPVRGSALALLHESLQLIESAIYQDGAVSTDRLWALAAELDFYIAPWERLVLSTEEVTMRVRLETREACSAQPNNETA
jgi:nucleoside diphosphate kinase